MTQVSTYTQQVVDALNEAHTPQPTGDFGSFWHHRFYAMPGQKFDRIVKQSIITSANPGTIDWTGQQRLVLSFVERTTGDIHYSAGWKAPAKWKNGPAVEWHGAYVGEIKRYAQFVKDGGWGYQGQREAWEAKNPVEPTPDEVEWPAKVPEKFDVKALADLISITRQMAKVIDSDHWNTTLSAYRNAWYVLTGTSDFDRQDDEINAVLNRTAHVAHTSDLT